MFLLCDDVFLGHLPCGEMTGRTEGRRVLVKIGVEGD